MVGGGTAAIVSTGLCEEGVGQKFTENFGSVRNSC